MIRFVALLLCFVTVNVQARTSGMMKAMIGAYGACYDLDSNWTPAWANLKTYYNFNEGFGASSLADTSPAGTNTGTTAASFAIAVAGKIGNGVRGSGSSGALTMSSVPTLGTGDFTISAWIKTSSTGSRKAIVSYGGGGNNQTTYLYVNGANQVEFDLAGVYGPTSSVTVTSGTWRHVAVVNTAGSMQIYVDGAASGSPVVMTPNIGNSSTRYVGQDDAGVNGFIGDIDEVAIWNVALSPGDLSAIYSNENGGTELASGWTPSWANIVAYWKFNEVGGASSLADSSSGGTNIITYSAASTGVPGRVKSGIAFSGNAVAMTSMPIVGSGAFSIAGWIKPTSTGVRQPIASIGSGSCASGIYLFVNAANLLEIDMSCTAGPQSTAVVSNGKWHHVVATYTGSVFQLYVDGKVSGGSSSLAVNIVADAQRFVGKDSSGNFYRGFIDDIAIWDVALSLPQIQKLYNQQSCSQN